MRIILLCLLLCMATKIQAQTCVSDRYKKAVFNTVSVAQNIVYQKADKYDVLNLNILEDIKLDVYMPVGDTLQKRPIVLFMFGGGFILGSKTDADCKAICDSLARYGYVAASVDYRLGLNTLSTGSAIRAVYRGVQDCRAAIRYLKQNHNTYNIDTNKIYLSGESAGAIVALHTSFLAQEADRPAETYGIFGENNDLGCLDCTGYFPQRTVKVKGIVDYWGAISSTNYIQATEQIPTLLIHGDADPIVPYNAGYPFTGSFALSFPYVYGSVPIHARMDSVSIYNEFYTYAGQGHVFYGTPTGVITFPNAFWAPIWAQTHKFLYTTQKFAAPLPTGPTSVFANSIQSYSVPFHAGSTYCWQASGGVVNSVTNSSTQASITWGAAGVGKILVTERNCNDVISSPDSLLVSINSTTGLSNTNLENNLFSVHYSQHQQLTLSTQSIQLLNKKVNTVIFNALGNLAQQNSFLNFSSHNIIPTQNLAPGIYFIKITNLPSVMPLKFVIL